MELMLKLIGNILLLLAIIIFVIGSLDRENLWKAYSMSVLLIILAGLAFAFEIQFGTEKEKEEIELLKKRNIKIEGFICREGLIFEDEYYIDKFKIVDDKVIDLKTGKVFPLLKCEPKKAGEL